MLFGLSPKFKFKGGRGLKNCAFLTSPNFNLETRLYLNNSIRKKFTIQEIIKLEKGSDLEINDLLHNQIN